MNRHRCHRVGSPPGPRGVLLLLVLISLSLFLLLGVALLVNATRSRMAARTFGTATDELEAYNDRAALDEALLVLLRGSQAALPPQVGESILADRYGASVDTIATAVPTLSGWPAAPILTATVAGNASLNGRVLTLVPLRSGDGDVLSFRILGGTGQLLLANAFGRPGRTLPTGTCRWLVNGRDFAGAFPANEPWDGFTTGSAVGGGAMSDPWLARVELASGGVAAVRQATYQAANNAALALPLPLECDNDNDGVLDGVWINGTSGFLAPRLSPRGGRITQRVSYLVLDLDGRLNVNAAGMAAPAAGSYAGSRDVPLGMGYGPADVDASLLFPATLPASTGLSAFTGAGASPSGTWWGVLVGGSATNGPPSAAPPRPRPGIGAFSGRYGPNGVPGARGDDSDTLQVTSSGSYSSTVGGTNAVGDLKGHARLFMSATVNGTPDALTPTMTWFLPVSGTDAADDPYEIRLGTGAPLLGGNQRTTGTSGNDDLPYTVGELERVLRPNDADASFLAQRLAAALGTSAQASRLLITTDSWDTPAVTGPAAARVESALTSRPPSYPWADTNAWSPDIAAGLRFDINRPVLAGTTPQARSEQQEYCKGLYALAMALGETNAQRAAQWAVNVLDFRDEDSTMTAFEYDTNLANGWGVDGNPATTGEADRGVVWGVERPDLLIADTAAWRGLSGSAMFVSVIRAPFNARRTVSGSTATVELPDPVLRVSGTDRLNARLAVGGTSSVWQLRLTTSGTDQAVAFGPVSASSSPQQFILVNGTVSGTPTLVMGGTAGVSGTAGLSGTGRESMVVIGGVSTTTIAPGTPPGPPTTIVNQGGTFAPPATAAGGTVRLERLADPNRANAADNPYIVVDAAPFTVSTAGTTADDGITQRLRRPGPRDTGAGQHPLAAFWQQPATWQADGKVFQTYHASAGIVASGSNDPVPWFHWPNRPFVSQAELALVPADGPDSLLRNYSFPTSSLAASSALVDCGAAGNAALGHLILDATIVSTRFAGNRVTLDAARLAGDTATAFQALGFNRLPAGQLALGREPGKMNVNTMPTGTTAATDGLLWQMLVGGTQTVLASGTLAANPFTATGTAQPRPARSLGQMVSLSGTTADQPPAMESVPAPSGGTVHPRAKNPFLALASANRLANTATVRSNVFAVWITVETTDSSPGAPPPVTRRLFAIIDRSVPVGYSRGEDLNVRDTIRLLRQLD